MQFKDLPQPLMIDPPNLINCIVIFTITTDVMAKLQQKDHEGGQ